MNKAISSQKAKALSGVIRVPGDKSISHRSLMFGALAIGETKIEGLLEGEDVLATAKAMQALGAEIVKSEEGLWRVRGRGVGGLVEPGDILDLGNAGTATRLLMGLVSTQKMLTFMTGDASLRRRPMGRVIDPLRKMGAEFLSREGKLPLLVQGTNKGMPIDYTLPVPSAQVKSAILLAGLNCPGVTIVREVEPTRDHTENMLRHFGAEVNIVKENGRLAISLHGQPELKGRDIRIPGDISSAAFPLVAASLIAGSELRLLNIGLNPYRTGILDSLLEMGADILIENQREEGGEPVGDLLVKSAELKGVEIPPERAPSMIDEYPIIAIAASCASGKTIMTGLKELRVKESDRLAAMAKGLALSGVEVEEGPDWLIVHGKGRPPEGGASIEVNLDHRIAMSFLVLGMVTEQAMNIDDASAIMTSFPDFVDLMNKAGARIG